MRTYKGKVKIFSITNLQARQKQGLHEGTSKVKTKPVLALIISIFIIGLMAPVVPAVGQIGSQIEQIFPASATGPVGTGVNLIGSIDTSNGPYKIFFGTTLVATANATGSAVNVGFYVPENPSGTYTITLQDLTTNSNATKDFTVTTSYSVTADLPNPPLQLQEGSTVTLNVSVSGGQPNTANIANITVTLPAPLSTNFSRLVTLPTSNSKGTATTQISFPDTTFEPSGALTTYAGIYQLYFNLSQSLASKLFTIGFTDLSQYHRGQTAKIDAIGYQPNDTATVNVKSIDSGATIYSADVTPTSGGNVTTQWAVPSNAAIGTYTIAITPHNTAKPVPDTQNVTVPGYPLTVRVKDLSSRPVSDILVEAQDATTNKTYDATSDAGGNASINLENGKATLIAFWNGLQVGQTSITVAGEGTFDLQCELGDLRIAVKDQNGLSIPSVSLAITYTYLTTKDQQSRSGSASGQTDTSGMYSLNSTPPGITYKIAASVYGVIFNEGNDSVSGLLAQAVSEVTILCPSRSLTFNVVDYSGNQISNARFSLLEVTAGIFYGADTKTDGSVTIQATLGRYKARVYAGSVLLNETLIDAFTDKQITIQCTIYNLQVNVKVVDYFGQAIPNANVKLVGADGKVQLQTSKPDGTTSFTGVTGGDVQIETYLSETDGYYEAMNVNVASSTTVEIQMGRYVTFAGLVVQTSLFITFLTILLAAIVFLVFELLMRRRNKPKKAAPTVEKAVTK